MQFVPLNQNVVVKKIAGSTTTSGGIILSASQEVDQCVVVAKAESVRQLEIGDKLLIRWSTALKVDDVHYIVPFENVISKVF